MGASVANIVNSVLNKFANWFPERDNGAPPNCIIVNLCRFGLDELDELDE